MNEGDPVPWHDLLARACASTRGVLAGVTGERLALPTPCADWQVRDLVEHIIGATDFFADLAEFGASPEERQWPEYTSGDFLAAFDRQAGRVVAGFTAPGAMSKIMALPTGPSPGSLAVQVATGEIFVHGWDLAKAVSADGADRTNGAADGTALRLDSAVAAALLSSRWLELCAQVRDADPAVFAPPVELADTAPPADRLAAFLGRDPRWPV